MTRIFKSYDIPVYHKPINTLRSLLVQPKDKTDKVAKCGVVYDIQCLDCNQHYIREPARPLGTQIKVHLLCRQPLSTVSEHKLNTGHQCSMRDVQILDLEENWYRRKRPLTHKGETGALARNSCQSCSNLCHMM